MRDRPTADIVIPTCRTRDRVRALLDEVRATATGAPRVIATCRPVCAAANRNLGLDQARTPYVVMLDDDVTGLPQGWNAALLSVFAAHPDAVMVAARLVHPHGGPAPMLGSPPPRPRVARVPGRELCTAACAVRNDGTRFDEGYLGSGWEDTDFCARLRGLYPRGTFWVHNGVRVVHGNERKRQARHFEANRRRYIARWGAPLGTHAR